MHVNYWLLSITLLLLWFPRKWMRHRQLKDRVSKSAMRLQANMREASVIWREQFLKVRNWVDLLRAAAGGMILWNFCFELPDHPPKFLGITVLAIKALLLFLAVGFQSLRHKSGRMTLVAPLFFIVGLSFPLIGWLPALYAIITLMVIHLALPTTGILLFVYGFLQIGFGYVLNYSPHMVVLLSAALVWQPVLWSAISKSKLERIGKVRLSRLA